MKNFLSQRRSIRIVISFHILLLATVLVRVPTTHAGKLWPKNKPPQDINFTQIENIIQQIAINNPDVEITTLMDQLEYRVCEAVQEGSCLIHVASLFDKILKALKKLYKNSQDELFTYFSKFSSMLSSMNIAFSNRVSEQNFEFDEDAQSIRKALIKAHLLIINVFVNRSSLSAKQTAEGMIELVVEAVRRHNCAAYIAALIGAVVNANLYHPPNLTTVDLRGFFELLSSVNFAVDTHLLIEPRFEAEDTQNICNALIEAHLTVIPFQSMIASKHYTDTINSIVHFVNATPETLKPSSLSCDFIDKLAKGSSMSQNQKQLVAALHLTAYRAMNTAGWNDEFYKSLALASISKIHCYINSSTVEEFKDAIKIIEIFIIQLSHNQTYFTELITHLKQTTINFNRVHQVDNLLLTLQKLVPFAKEKQNLKVIIDASRNLLLNVDLSGIFSLSLKAQYSIILIRYAIYKHQIQMLLIGTFSIICFLIERLCIKIPKAHNDAIFYYISTTR